MRRRRSLLFLRCVLFAAWPVAAVEAAATHTWKPQADWLPPTNQIIKLLPRTVEHSEVRIRMGDDIRWAAPDWDDSDWQVIGRDRLPLHAGIFWLRLRVRTLGRDERLPSLVFSDEKAHDFYCDGVLVHSSGVPGNSPQEEVDGMTGTHFELPPDATIPGEHVFALRMSSYHWGAVGARFARLGLSTLDSDKFRMFDSKMNMLPAMGIGSMLTIALAVFVIWLLAARRLILLLFSALCFSAATLVAVATAPPMWSYPTSWIYYQSLGRIVFVVVVAGLLVGITLLQFHPSRSRRWLIVPFMIAGILAWHYASLRAAMLILLWRMAFGAVLLVASAAAWRRREGAWWVIAGTVGTVLLFERDPRHFDMNRFALVFLPVMVGLIAAIALQVRRERLQARDAKLTAARLEIELLRKNLQPHFLLNTLTTLSQVLEERPSTAVRLIEDLAAEFRSLNRLSTQKEVPLAEELALCRAHLRVMSVRTECAWSLETEGVDPAAFVPPALFLTLIENGFSHQRVREGSPRFRLRAERAGTYTRYTFLSPGTITVEPDRLRGGTGLRYVRSRLDESFPGAWNLSQREVPGGWETVIKLNCAARDGVIA